jgi:Divergent InlB B-repeat domain
MVSPDTRWVGLRHVARSVSAALMAVGLALGLAISLGPRAADAFSCGVDVACYTLTVDLLGYSSDGSGLVQSTNGNYVPYGGGIDCQELNGAIAPGSTCSATFMDVLHQGYVMVYLLLTPAADSLRCDLAANCHATPLQLATIATGGTLQGFGFFKQAHTLTVRLSGTGSGTWKSTNASYVPDGLIDCAMVNGVVAEGSVCSHAFPDLSHTGVEVHFQATPATGSQVCIDGVGCYPDGSNSRTAFYGDTVWDFNSFALIAYPLTVTKTGAGSGMVTGQPAGIDCGATCTASIAYGTKVTLTAAPDKGSAFVGWTGVCQLQGATCIFALTGPSAANAVFGAASPTSSTRPASTPRSSPVAIASEAASPAADDTGPSSSPVASLATSTGPGSPTPATGSASPVASLATSAGPGSPTPATGSGSPASPPATGLATTDLTPAVLAIIVGALIIAIGIAAAGFQLRRRGGRR